MLTIYGYRAEAPVSAGGYAANPGLPNLLDIVMKPGPRSFVKIVLLTAVVLLAQGCAAISSRPAGAGIEQPGCRAFLERIDQATDKANIKDASSFRVLGYPYLRTNRFLTALAGRAKTEQQRDELLQLMRRLDQRSIEKEVLNLPDSEVPGLLQDGPVKTGRNDLIARSLACSDELFGRDRSGPDMMGAVYPLLKVPDEYSSLRRAIGLFPVMSIPVNIVSERVKKRLKAWYDEKIEQLPVKGDLKFYTARMDPGHSAPLVAELLRSASDNPLRIPLLQPDKEREVAALFAPVFIQDVAGLYDRIGRVRFDASRPEIDPLKPTVYYYISHALLKDRPVLQINYVVWYSGRAGAQSPWIERGHLDGLTLRVSLDPDGKPFMVDMMNNCGCYHFFSPGREEVLRIKPAPWGIEPFVPQWLPEVPPGKHLGVRVNSGWHQVEHLMAVNSPRNAIEYELVPYSLLESLPDGSGGHRSMFDADGIAVGTERVEPLIFFSMGIPSVGSMRQRGHHAIELTGRAHFDDPLLFEKNFIFR